MVRDRLFIEEQEEKLLSDLAQKSSKSKGRLHDEALDELRTIYQQDRDRIIHSKSFRRLKHKTQVFLSPEGDHYRTRLTHTLEVAQIARTMARALGLNEDLTEAIALAHDLGHTPFGHCGEHALDKIHEGGFIHAEQSLRVVEFIERRPGKDFRGLNLSREVLDGIKNHTGANQASTLEGQIIKFADRIAYINHDIDDAIRAGIMTEEELKPFQKVLGIGSSSRIHNMIMNVIYHSDETIHMSDDMYRAMMELRTYLFSNLYHNPIAKGEEVHAEKMVMSLYRYFLEFPDELPADYQEDYKTEGKEAVKDYIAGMTDRYAVSVFKKIFIPSFWQ